VDLKGALTRTHILYIHREKIARHTAGAKGQGNRPCPRLRTPPSRHCVRFPLCTTRMLSTTCVAHNMVYMVRMLKKYDRRLAGKCSTGNEDLARPLIALYNIYVHNIMHTALQWFFLTLRYFSLVYRPIRL